MKVRRAITIYPNDAVADELDKIREYISMTKAVQLCLTKKITLTALRKGLKKELSGERESRQDGKK